MKKRTLLLQLKTLIEKNAELNNEVSKLKDEIIKKDNALKFLNNKVFELETEIKNNNSVSECDSDSETETDFDDDLNNTEPTEAEINAETAVELSEDTKDLKEKILVVSKEIGKLTVYVAELSKKARENGNASTAIEIENEFEELKQKSVAMIRTESSAEETEKMVSEECEKFKQKYKI